MQLTVKSLTAHLNKRQLLPVYCISGNELLQRRQVIEQIRRLAQQLGWMRNVYHIEPGFSWENVQKTLANFNLWGDNTLVELHNPKASFDKTVAHALTTYLNKPATDKTLVVVMDKLSVAAQKTKWYQLIAKIGAIITVDHLSLAHTRHFVQERLRQLGLVTDKAALDLLLELTQGNLMATEQAIAKLELLYPDKHIDVEMMTTVLTDQADFSVMDVMQYMRRGQTSLLMRCLRHLKNTGVPETLVLWAILRELRRLLTHAWQAAQSSGASPRTRVHNVSGFKDTHSIPGSQLSYPQLAQAFQRALAIDRMIKGRTVGHPWLEMEQLCLYLLR